MNRFGRLYENDKATIRRHNEYKALIARKKKELLESRGDLERVQQLHRKSTVRKAMPATNEQQSPQENQAVPAGARELHGRPRGREWQIWIGKDK